MIEKSGSSGQTIQTIGPSEPGQDTSKPRDLNILVCTPVIGDIKSRAAWSIARAMVYFMTLPYDGKKSVDWEIIQSSNLAEQRTRLVSRAMGREATHILWVDSDNVIPLDTIPKLLNHGVPIVGANYPTKEVLSRPTAYRDDDEYVGPVWTTENDTGLVEVAHCGMGCLLVDERVFEEIEIPFFVQEPTPPDFLTITTEDVYFCRKARTAGFKIFIDHDLSKHVAHIGDFEYTNFIANKAKETKNDIYKGLPT